MASYLLAPIEGVLQLMVSLLQDQLISSKLLATLFQIDGHERYIYNPMHYYMKPVVQRIPRRLTVCGHKLDVFTANAVTYFRTALVIAISICLK